MISAFLAFTFYLRPPPVVSRIIEPAPIQVVTNVINQVSYGMCPVPEKRCDIDGIVNNDRTHRLQWVCRGYECEIAGNGQKLLQVAGEGFLDRIPLGTGSPLIFKITSSDNSCTDSWSFTP